MSAITYDDRQWLLGNQPGLFVLESAKSALVQGLMRFRRSYRDLPDREFVIEDEYRIRLELFEERHPRIHELGGRLNQKLEDNPELTQADLHLLRGGALCIAAPQQLSLVYMPQRKVSTLFSEYLEPYFYSQTYHEIFDVWPWAHLPHGSEGILTWYLNNSHLLGSAKETVKELKKLAHDENERAEFLLEYGSRRDSFAINNQCLCGSRRRYRECHSNLWKLAFTIRNGYELR